MLTKDNATLLRIRSLSSRAQTRDRSLPARMYNAGPAGGILMLRICATMRIESQLYAWFTCHSPVGSPQIASAAFGAAPSSWSMESRTRDFSSLFRSYYATIQGFLDCCIPRSAFIYFIIVPISLLIHFYLRWRKRERERERNVESQGVNNNDIGRYFVRTESDTN